MDKELNIIEEQIEILNQAYLKMVRREYRKGMNYRKWNEKRKKRAKRGSRRRG